MKTYLHPLKYGHDFLRELCSIKPDYSSFNPSVHPTTNRVNYIVHELIKMGLDYSYDMYDCDDVNKLTLTKNKYVNIVVKFPAQKATDNSIIFLAHHDIKNLDAENAQDNSASVCNLLHLCQYLNVLALEKNIYIVFTDAEEVGGMGARRLGLMINRGDFGKVLFTVNLELTGMGNRLFVSAISHSQLNFNLIQTCVKKFDAVIKRIPFADSTILESIGIKSITIGLLPPDEVLEDFPKTWGLIHTQKDTFDKTNREDMYNFVNKVLIKLILFPPLY